MSAVSIDRFAVIVLTTLLSGSAMTAEARADDFTSKAVMEKLPAEQRYSYLAGVVEGLAYSRYMRDGKKTDGMKCVYDWFYNKPETLNLIYAAMGRYPDFTPGAIIGALANQNCGA
jgi:hypothetical protein